MNESATVDLPDQIGAYIDALVNTGLYGSTPEEVMLNLVTDGIRGAVRHGYIKPLVFTLKGDCGTLGEPVAEIHDRGSV